MFDAVSACRRPLTAAGQVPANGPEGAEAALPAVHRFTLRTLQREIGSSPAAVRPTLLALAEKPALSSQREALLGLADRAGSLASWTKGQALERLLLSKLAADGQEKLIIFTHFHATLDLLADLLRGMGVDVVTLPRPALASGEGRGHPPLRAKRPGAPLDRGRR